MTVIDIEAIEHLDFDASEEDVCQADKCEVKPIWSLTLPCCFWTIKICDSCLRKHIRWLNLMAVFNIGVTHHPCGHDYTADEMLDTQLVVPL